MKSKYIISAVAFSLLIINNSCKKNPVNTSETMLQNKWTFLNALINDYYSGTDHMATITGNPGDYFNFRTDGKVDIRLQSTTTTSTYKLSGDAKVIFNDTDTAIIKELTDNSLRLYFKTVTSANNYSEKTYNLSK